MTLLSALQKKRYSVPRHCTALTFQGNKADFQFFCSYKKQPLILTKRGTFRSSGIPLILLVDCSIINPILLGGGQICPHPPKKSIITK